MSVIAIYQQIADSRCCLWSRILRGLTTNWWQCADCGSPYRP